MSRSPDVLIGAVLTAAGIGIVGLMVYPLLPLRHVERAAAVVTDFGRRWPPALQKAGRLGPRLTVAGLLPPPLGEERSAPPPAVAGGPVEQALERKAEDREGERAAREYRRRTARLEEPRDVCARHGMHKHYSHRRHHLSWRCVGHGR